ncbi:hypothetical protein O9992_13100 [Vibrio lentus]|nr:hypothetical protein [Vibrio lentus]
MIASLLTAINVVELYVRCYLHPVFTGNPRFAMVATVRERILIWAFYHLNDMSVFDNPNSPDTDTGPTEWFMGQVPDTNSYH